MEKKINVSDNIKEDVITVTEEELIKAVREDAEFAFEELKSIETPRNNENFCVEIVNTDIDKSRLPSSMSENLSDQQEYTSWGNTTQNNHTITETFIHHIHAINNTKITLSDFHFNVSSFSFSPGGYDMTINGRPTISQGTGFSMIQSVDVKVFFIDDQIGSFYATNTQPTSSNHSTYQEQKSGVLNGAYYEITGSGDFVLRVVITYSLRFYALNTGTKFSYNCKLKAAQINHCLTIGANGMLAGVNGDNYFSVLSSEAGTNIVMKGLPTSRPTPTGTGELYVDNGVLKVNV